MELLDNDTSYIPSHILTTTPEYKMLYVYSNLRNIAGRVLSASGYCEDIKHLRDIAWAVENGKPKHPMRSNDLLLAHWVRKALEEVMDGLVNSYSIEEVDFHVAECYERCMMVGDNIPDMDLLRDNLTRVTMKWFTALANIADE